MFSESKKRERERLLKRTTKSSDSLSKSNPSIFQQRRYTLGGGGNILNILNSSLRDCQKKKKKQTLGGLAENTSIVSQKENRPDES